MAHQHGTYPGMRSQRDRDNVAGILARWRRLRAEAAQAADSIDRTAETKEWLKEWQGKRSSEKMWDDHIRGAREILEELFGSY